MGNFSKDSQAYQAHLEYMREYNRRYRAAHPEAVKRWRDAYTMRRAARLKAEAEADRGGADNAGN